MSPEDSLRHTCLREASARSLLVDDERDFRGLLRAAVEHAEVECAEHRMRRALERTAARELGPFGALAAFRRLGEEEWRARVELTQLALAQTSDIAAALAQGCAAIAATAESRRLLAAAAAGAVEVARMESRARRAMCVAAEQEQREAAGYSMRNLQERRRECERVLGARQRVEMCQMAAADADEAGRTLRDVRRHERVRRIDIVDEERSAWSGSVVCAAPALECLTHEAQQRTSLEALEVSDRKHIAVAVYDSFRDVRIAERKRIVVQAHIAARAHTLFVEHRNFRNRQELAALEEFVAIEEAFFDELRDVPHREEEGAARRAAEQRQRVAALQDAQQQHEELLRAQIEMAEEDEAAGLWKLIRVFLKRLARAAAVERNDSPCDGSPCTAPSSRATEHVVDITFYDSFFDSATRRERQYARWTAELREHRGRVEIERRWRDDHPASFMLVPRAFVELQSAERCGRENILHNFMFYNSRDRLHRATVSFRVASFGLAAAADAAAAAEPMCLESEKKAVAAEAGLAVAHDEEGRSAAESESPSDEGLHHRGFSRLKHTFDELRRSGKAASSAGRWGRRRGSRSFAFETADVKAEEDEEDEESEGSPLLQASPLFVATSLHRQRKTTDSAPAMGPRSPLAVATSSGKCETNDEGAPVPSAAATSAAGPGSAGAAAPEMSRPPRTDGSCGCTNVSPYEPSAGGAAAVATLSPQAPSVEPDVLMSQSRLLRPLPNPRTLRFLARAVHENVQQR